MEHANKAFIMAGGMLFALMVMSLVAFVFGRLTTLPTEEDFREKAKQTAAFNNEYSAYDKKIMYGVDIISVLNKALSNNNKYVNEDSAVFSGGGYSTDFVIDIQVTLNTPLQESIRISHVQNTANDRVTEVPYTNGDGPRKNPTTFYSMIRTVPTDPKLFTAPSGDYQALIYGSRNAWNSWKFVTQENISTNVSAGFEYHLLGRDGEHPDPVNDSVSEKDRQLKADNTLKELLKYSTVMSQTIKNRDGNTFAPGGWSQAEWKPAIYDLKTRKFECLGEQTVTSEKTGRIVQMIFREKLP